MPQFPSEIGSNRYESAGEDGTISAGTVIVSDASAHTKGNWTELIASSSFRSYAFILNWCSNDTEDYLIDIGVGANPNETPIVENILSNIQKLEVSAMTHTIPVMIPEGSRITARMQDTTGAKDGWVNLQLIGSPFLAGPALGRATTYGANTADTGGVEVDPGATLNTKGAWSEIAASTTNPIKALSVFIGSKNNAALGAARFLIDIGVGANPNEKVIIPNLAMHTNITSDIFIPMDFGPYPVNIPEGSRLVARAQCSINSSTDRLFDVVIVGYD